MKIFKWLFGGVEYVDYTVSTEEKFSDICLVISRTEKHYKTIFDYIFNNNNQYLYSEKVLLRSEVELKLPVFKTYGIEKYLEEVLFIHSPIICGIKIKPNNTLEVQYKHILKGYIEESLNEISVELVREFGGFNMKYLQELADKEPRTYNKF